MELPHRLIAEVKDRRVVLVLGSGASQEAKDGHGGCPPSATELARMLATKFLGEAKTELPLAQVAEYAISESSMLDVQKFIKDIFEPYGPGEAHREMTQIAWRGLATTNYDRVIERAYAECQDAVQNPGALISNNDSKEEVERRKNGVVLLKLHGCISRSWDTDCPLILTTDQYIQHKAGRDRLFGILTDWGYDNTLVFVGHGLQDPDLRAMLLELTSHPRGRKRTFAVLNQFDAVATRFWETKQVTLLKGTFGELIGSLLSEIPKHVRQLAAIRRPEPLRVTERFADRAAALSPGCLRFLELDVEYVKDVRTDATLLAREFYKGMNLGWAAVERGLDVGRNLADTILAESFLIEEHEHIDRMELVVIRAHAGAGKSTLLSRIAWDASHDYDCFCLFATPNGTIDVSAVQEVISQTKGRVFLFVDDAADRVSELHRLAERIGPEGKHLTVVVAERINEWNVACEELIPFVTATHELRYLSEGEIDKLLTLLEIHDALGTLKTASLEERKRAFSERAGRQLLVALHEATLGKRFEDIIEDEYQNIRPVEAQRIYLTVCVLNRLRVPVRAGIISRVHEVSFADFKEKFLAPLERVVSYRLDSITGDYVYTARHPHIAEIVFLRVLRTQEQRYLAYVRALQNLNVMWSSDLKAYRQLVRARTLMELFPDFELVARIYDEAGRALGADAYLRHQQAIYEMNRPNGNLKVASELLDAAGAQSPDDMSVTHSMAELCLRKAEHARTPLEREKRLDEAAVIALKIIGARKDSSYGLHTLIKIGLLRLKHLSESGDDASQADIEEAVNGVETVLSRALQLFPGDPYIQESEAQLARLLSDSNRMVDALQRAFDANPRNPSIARRLAQYHREHGDTSRAREVLEKAIEAKRTDHSLHFAYALLLLETAPQDSANIEYHLERSFTPGDDKYLAQVLLGRQQYVNGKLDLSKATFRELKSARVGEALRDGHLYPLDDEHQGYVRRLESNYCFLRRDGRDDWIFAHRSSFLGDCWDRVWAGHVDRVTFRIAFNVKGPTAFDVSCESVAP